MEKGLSHSGRFSVNITNLLFTVDNTDIQCYNVSTLTVSLSTI